MHLGFLFGLSCYSGSPALMREFLNLTWIGLCGRPNTSTTSVMKSKVTADTKPRCLPQTEQRSDAKCGPADEPIVASVAPHVHTEGKVTVRPSTDVEGFVVPLNMSN
jgi:hypothetical protein